MNPSTALARVLIDELVRGGVREVVLAPGRAPRPSRMPSSRPSAKVACACTCGWTSAPQGSWLWGSPRALAHRCPSSRRPGQRSPTCTRRCSRRTTPECHSSCSRPTGPRSCGGPGPTRRRCNRGSSARRSAGRWTCRHPSSSSQWGPSTARRCAGPSRPPSAPPSEVRARAPAVRCTSTWRSVTRSHPSRTARESSIRAGPTGVPGSGSHCRAGTPTSRCRPAPRTLVVLGDLASSPVRSSQVVEWAQGRGFPVITEPMGDHDRSQVVPHGPLLLADPDWVAAHLPDRVVIAGRVTLSRAVGSLLRSAASRSTSIPPVPSGPTPGTWSRGWVS